MIELQVQFFGTVQGVCFRKTIFRHAQALNLYGFVKNLDDGSVKVVLQGTQEELNSFLENVLASPGAALIESYKDVFSKPGVKFSEFKILY